MDSSVWFVTVNLGWSIVYIKGYPVIIKKKTLHFLPEDLFHHGSVDPDEMLHYTPFYLGLHCCKSTNASIQRANRPCILVVI